MADIQAPGLDEAVAITIRNLKERVARGLIDNDCYGYDFWAERLSEQVGHQIWRQGSQQDRPERYMEAVAPVFYEAAWLLCQRGLLRPGIRGRQTQPVPDGLGYSVTSFGKQWLSEAEADDYIVLQPGALADTLRGFAGRFGEGYNQRTQEAVLCRNIQAWLACCAMVGAATEAILLALAVDKRKDEDKVLRVYHAGNGRLNVTKIVTQGLKDHAKDTLTTFLGLLVYWRDDAAHGGVTEVSQANADEALRQLLHFSQWAHRNWDMLTS